MGDDLEIDIGELNDLKSALDAIITEFDHATSNSEALESAIGDPFGESKLREEAQEFEERWDDKRGDLKKGLEKIRDHVAGVIEGFQTWDTDTAISLTPES